MVENVEKLMTSNTSCLEIDAILLGNFRNG